MSEVTQTAKYKVLYNRLTGSTPFAASTAIARITALADALEITQDEAAELTALAQERGTTGAAGGGRSTPVGAGRGRDGAGGNVRQPNGCHERGDVSMAKIYKRWIDAGRMTIDDVPERWREQVRKLLDAEAHEE